MKTEFLKELGLEQSVIDQIMAENGKDIAAHKQRYDVEKARADELQKQLTEANKQIDGFKGMDIEGVKKSADDWKAKFEAAEKKAKEDLDALRFDHALDNALSGSKARSAKAVKAFLDMSTLKLTDSGEISGLKEQLEKIRSENDYLFEQEKQPPRFGAPTGGFDLPGGDDMAAARAVMGLPPLKQ